MSSRDRKLLVHPNPYHALDDMGNPAGILPIDPEHAPTVRRFIGAELAAVEVLDRKEEGDLRHPRQYNTWKFDLVNPVELPETQYYLEALKTGVLLPANRETAKRAGMAFPSLTTMLQDARVEAAFKWRDAQGEFPDWFVVEEEETKDGTLRL